LSPQLLLEINKVQRVLVLHHKVAEGRCSEQRFHHVRRIAWSWGALHSRPPEQVDAQGLVSGGGSVIAEPHRLAPHWCRTVESQSTASAFGGLWVAQKQPKCV